jgi:hypothetical protein
LAELIVDPPSLRYGATGGVKVDSGIGMKVTEIGMIVGLHELLGDFGEADSPGTQFNELLNGLLIFHDCLSSGRHW